MRYFMAGGLLLVAGGLLLMHGVSVDSEWTTLLGGFILAGIGIGLINPPLASTAIGVVRPQQSGMASGINTTFRQVGIATGIAALGAIFQARVESKLSTSAAARRPPSGRTSWPRRSPPAGRSRRSAARRPRPAARSPKRPTRRSSPASTTSCWSASADRRRRRHFRAGACPPARLRGGRRARGCAGRGVRLAACVRTGRAPCAAAIRTVRRPGPRQSGRSSSA